MNFGFINKSTKLDFKSVLKLTDEDLDKDIIIVRNNGITFLGKLVKSSFSSSFPYKLKTFDGDIWTIYRGEYFAYDTLKLHQQIQKIYEQT